MNYEDLLSNMSLFDYQQLVMAKNTVDNKKWMDHRMVIVLEVIAEIE
jgi:hypothetical protein